ncbi:hypothetical protein PYK79_48370 [Streptomyces sp. ID05-04B]|uniref:hypothetical protein n=1 Tax=Streptomyces sp. ID05-04B TaxID=3028661 RepID=UPI0029C1B9AF|nr:hypothetical protein [Streptomyces sp. ID05-04B]MDX5569519.1 hypothetical protein [Streptomyces sp. ID05-04B]
MNQTPEAGQIDAIEDLRAELAKLIRWHSEDETAMKKMRDTITRLRAELATARDRVAELETYAYGCDAEGCTIPHSSWCETAKKTAAANNGCTCGKPWTGHPQPHAMHCWTVNPPRAEVQEMRKKVAEVIAGRDAAAIELREAARKAIAKAEAERDAPRTLTEGEYFAAWHAVEGAAGEEGADPATVLHAVLDRLGINPPARPAS